MRFLGTLLSLLLCCTLQSVHAREATTSSVVPHSTSSDKTPFVATVNATTLNVRTGTSTGHRVVSTLKKGDEVTVYETRKGWNKIPYPSTLWVYKKYLSIKGGWGTITGDRINLRDLQTSNVRSRVIIQLNHGDRLEVKKISGDWVEVLAPEGAYAWVFGKYLNYLAPFQVWLSEKRDSKIYERIMAQANAQLQDQLQKPQEGANYQEIIALFNQAKKLTKDEAEHNIIDLKIAQAQHNQLLVDKLRKIQSDREDLARDLNSMKQSYKQKVAEIEEIKKPKLPTYLTVGWIAPVGRYYNRPAPFRLIKGAQVLYYLDSDAYDLNLYLNKWVGIKGTVGRIKGSALKHITVTGIDILRVGDKGFKVIEQ